MFKWKKIFFFADKYIRRVRGETVEKDIAVTSLDQKTLGTYYFPHTPESHDSQNEMVK